MAKYLHGYYAIEMYRNLCKEARSIYEIKLTSTTTYIYPYEYNN